jgi:hypothetical protein
MDEDQKGDRGATSYADRTALKAAILIQRRPLPEFQRLGFIIQSLLKGACMFQVANTLAREF